MNKEAEEEAKKKIFNTLHLQKLYFTYKKLLL